MGNKDPVQEGICYFARVLYTKGLFYDTAQQELRWGNHFSFPDVSPHNEEPSSVFSSHHSTLCNYLSNKYAENKTTIINWIKLAFTYAKNSHGSRLIISSNANCSSRQMGFLSNEAGYADSEQRRVTFSIVLDLGLLQADMQYRYSMYSLIYVNCELMWCWCWI